MSRIVLILTVAISALRAQNSQSREQWKPNPFQLTIDQVDPFPLIPDSALTVHYTLRNVSGKPTSGQIVGDVDGAPLIRPNSADIKSLDTGQAVLGTLWNNGVQPGKHVVTVKYQVDFLTGGIGNDGKPSVGTNVLAEDTQVIEALEPCPPLPVTTFNNLKQFDLVSPPPHCRRMFQFDGNGLFRNPFWASQLWSPEPQKVSPLPQNPDSTPAGPCKRFASTTTLGFGNRDIDPNNLSACMSAQVWLENANFCAAFDYWKNPISKADAFYNLYFRGHINFQAVTYDGTLHFQSHDTTWDRDYDWLLEPVDPLDPSHSMGTPGAVSSGDHDGLIGIEYQADRNGGGSYATGNQLLFDWGVMDRYKNLIPQAWIADDWWMALSARIDQDEKNNDGNYTTARQLVENVDYIDGGVNKPSKPARAVITGLLGLDCGHFCAPELHPAYAVAVRFAVKNDYSANQLSAVHEDWAVFARNWGGEGYCSSGAFLGLGLPANKFTLILPQPRTQGLSHSEKFVFGKGKNAANIPYTVSNIPMLGAKIEFDMPDPSEEGLVMGTIHLDYDIPWVLYNQATSSLIAQTMAKRCPACDQVSASLFEPSHSASGGSDMAESSVSPGNTGDQRLAFYVENSARVFFDSQSFLTAPNVAQTGSVSTSLQAAAAADFPSPASGATAPSVSRLSRPEEVAALAVSTQATCALPSMPKDLIGGCATLPVPPWASPTQPQFQPARPQLIWRRATAGGTEDVNVVASGGGDFVELNSQGLRVSNLGAQLAGRLSDPALQWANAAESAPSANADGTRKPAAIALQSLAGTVRIADDVTDVSGQLQDQYDRCGAAGCVPPSSVNVPRPPQRQGFQAVYSQSMAAVFVIGGTTADSLKTPLGDIWMSPSDMRSEAWSQRTPLMPSAAVTAIPAAYKPADVRAATYGNDGKLYILDRAPQGSLGDRLRLVRFDARTVSPQVEVIFSGWPLLSSSGDEVDWLVADTRSVLLARSTSSSSTHSIYNIPSAPGAPMLIRGGPLALALPPLVDQSGAYTFVPRQNAPAGNLVSVERVTTLTNDAFTTAISIPSAGGLLTGDTTNLSNHIAAPSCAPPGGLGPTAAYTLNFKTRTRVLLSTAGSAFNNVLFVIRPNVTPPAVAEVACNHGSPATPASSIDATLDAGDYRILVAGNTASDHGLYQLRVTPVNDTLDASQVIPAGGGILTGDTTKFVNHYSAPSCASSAGLGPNAVYSLNLQTRSRVRVSTAGSAFSTVLSVTSPAAGSLAATEVACSGNPSPSLQNSIDVTLDSGVYNVILAGYKATDAGAYKLQVALSAP